MINHKHECGCDCDAEEREAMKLEERLNVRLEAQRQASMGSLFRNIGIVLLCAACGVIGAGLALLVCL